MSASDERMRILQMIEDGKISAADGLRLLNTLSGAKAEAQAEGGGAETGGEARVAPPPPAPEAEPSPPIPEMGKWKTWWLIPLWIGLANTVLGGLLMYWAYTAGGFSFWFVCAALPFFFGVLVMALASASRTARWIHIRVNTGEQEWPRRISLSFPLPIRLTAWFLRVFGQFIPKLQKTGVDELILALEDSTSPENPLFVDVHEGEGGERVQVYIG
jgi:hypothetical protein